MKTALPSYEKLGKSPALPSTGSALILKFDEKVNRTSFAKDAIWPVYGAYLLDEALTEQFGLEAEDYIIMIVFHKESRKIFTGRIVKDESLPRKKASEPSGGGAVVASSGYFALDLKAHCRIPPQPGTYYVIAMLGTLTNKGIVFTVR